MISNQNYINFIPGVIPPNSKNDDDLWFIFYDDKLLLARLGESVSIPTWSMLISKNFNVNLSYYLGSFNGNHCYSADLEESPLNSDILMLVDLRSAGLVLTEELFFVAGKATQIINWDKTHKYCGRCGSLTETKIDERAKVCPKCGLINFPRISPAIIVAVTRGNEILLAHNYRFPENLYSIIAGFVEPGETFEQCVKREVLEEVGIKVKNIQYFSSQPWPFPNSIMIGFTAEYEEGTIKADGIEIEHADWFTIYNLPNLPSKASVARKLIDNFIEKTKGAIPFDKGFYTSKK